MGTRIPEGSVAEFIAVKLGLFAKYGTDMTMEQLKPEISLWVSKYPEEAKTLVAEHKAGKPYSLEV